MIKTNKRISSFLLLTLLVLWGTIAYQIIVALDDRAADVVINHEPSQPAQKEKGDFEFGDSVRDPFRYVIRKSPKPAVQSASIQMWAPPPFRLTGIVTAGKKRVAVLESADGATYFVSEGESISGVKLLSILERSVKYQYQNQTRDWALN